MSGVKTYRLLVSKVFHSKAKVTQDSNEGAFRNIFPFVVRDGSKASVCRVPPDFVRARALSGKLATQLAEFPGQHAVSHTGTTSSA